MKQPDSQELMYRIRIGLTGLACVFLIVLMGAIFAKFVREGEAEQARDAISSGAPAPAAEPEAAPADPLAELGVAPGKPAEAEPEADNAVAP